jgi:hypothetical protein
MKIYLYSLKSELTSDGAWKNKSLPSKYKQLIKSIGVHNLFKDIFIFAEHKISSHPTIQLISLSFETNHPTIHSPITL